MSQKQPSHKICSFYIAKIYIHLIYGSEFKQLISPTSDIYSMFLVDIYMYIYSYITPPTARTDSFFRQILECCIFCPLLLSPNTHLPPQLKILLPLGLRIQKKGRISKVPDCQAMARGAGEALVRSSSTWCKYKPGFHLHSQTVNSQPFTCSCKVCQTPWSPVSLFTDNC